MAEQEQGRATNLHRKGKEFLSLGDYAAARECLKEALALHMLEFDLDVLSDYVTTLEAMVEDLAHFAAPCNKEAQRAKGGDDSSQDLLNEIAVTYGRISELKREEMLDTCNVPETNKATEDDVADSLLDYAIACKRAGKMRECALAHVKRMELHPRYFRTDAVRLLGLKNVSCIRSELSASDDEERCDIEEIFREGIFQAEVDDRRRYRPSGQARKIGSEAGDVFWRRGYSLRVCTQYLLPYIQSCAGETISENRIFSANSFFNHRHEAESVLFALEEKEKEEDETIDCDELQVLVWLFLFGIAVNRKRAEDVLGKTDLAILFQAGLIRNSAARPSDIVGEVQIYPLSPTDMCGTLGVDDCCLFVTDFPMESMRLPRNAVMSVGYDTLELLSLSADTSNCACGHTLDLCCGSGIQGIFAMWCTLCEKGLSSFDELELVMADLNERALHFATANVALNNTRHRGQETSRASYALRGDLFDALKSIEGDMKFDRILSNPPFVAVPSCHASPQLEPALYAVGGGADGMDILRSILSNCFEFLGRSEKSMLLMVTEVPNVQESCAMLRSFIPERERAQARVRVAYVEDDVETTEGYSHEREIEAGIESSSRDWATALLNDGVYNRALVLVSVSRDRGDNLNGIASFRSDDAESFTGNNDQGDATCSADGEDAFLRSEGIAFSRKALL